MKHHLTSLSTALLLASAITMAGVTVGYAQDSAGSFNAGAAQVPPRGTYDGYNGPGSTVLRKTLKAQHEPGVAEDLAPDAKQTATGGPSGGLPGMGGGGR